MLTLLRFILSLRVSLSIQIATALLFHTLYLPAQSIVDDTTKQLYGTKTTFFFTEKSIFETSPLLWYAVKQRPDTTPTDFHEYDTHFNKHITPRQDLGNLASAATSLFFETNEKIGRQNGMTVYDHIGFDATHTHYYNTQSPHSHLYYVQSQKGRQVLKTGITRNILPNLNVGIKWKRFFALKQIGADGKTDRDADVHNVEAQLNYISKNLRYVLLANYIYHRYEDFQTGGILPLPNTSRAEWFEYEATRVRLKRPAKALQTNHNFHFYQQYSLTENHKLQVFHVLDRVRQFNYYFDYDPVLGAATDTTFGFANYPEQLRFIPYIHEDMHYESLENKAGLKGFVGKHSSIFFSAYFKRRDFSLTNRAYNRIVLPTTFSGNEKDTILNPERFENYVGGQVAWKPSQSFLLNGKAEKLLNGQDYLLTTAAQWQIIKSLQLYANLMQKSQAPDLVQQYHFSNLYEWSNNFENRQTTRFISGLSFGTSWIKIEPKLTFHLLQNHIYWGTDRRPAQNKDLVAITSWGAKVHTNWKGFNLLLDYAQHQLTGNDVIRFPKEWFRTKFYYENPLFKRALYLQVGIDVRRRMGYYGYAFAPVLQQFYLQNDFLLEDYWVVDAFANMRIRNVQFFLRMPHLNQGLVKSNPSYFDTPWFPARQRVFEFGFNWQFYD